jgi:glucans biosynthesis protein
MTPTLSRRAFILAAAASGIAASGAALAEGIKGITLSGPVPFSFDGLIATAREMAMKPFAPTPVRGAELLEKIDFDAYQQITFRPEDSLFKGTRYPVRLFHLGRYFKSPVKIAVVEGDYTIKRLHQQHGRIELRPDNPAYQAIVLSAERPLEVWGVVVGVVRRLTRRG